MGETAGARLQALHRGENILNLEFFPEKLC